jgi:GT2 family glycosyltransferase
MLRIDRKELQAPCQVIDLELSPVGQYKEEKVSVEGYRSLWCLSRVNGIPFGISLWDVGAESTVSRSELRDRLLDEAGADPILKGYSPAAPTADFEITVVICSRDHPEELRKTMRSLRSQTDSDFRVLVVGNAPTTPETAAVAAEFARPGWEYVVEPQPGLSRARNKGLQTVTTGLIAFIDDDEVADPDFIRRLKEGFAHESKPAAVCGMVVPAELEHESQIRFEQYGGFNKSRGLTPEVLLAGTPSITSPLYPLPSFGPGGNMAFQTDILREIGGFDPCLGAGTRTHGCEETQVLSLLLSGGHAILHWPAAIIWHTHRKNMDALRKQLYGYSAGLSAFYMSTIRSKPTAVFEILRLVPHALRDMRGGSENLRSGHLPDDFPVDLKKAARRGLLDGGPMYVYEAIKGGRQATLATRRKILSNVSRP